MNKKRKRDNKLKEAYKAGKSKLANISEI